MSLSRRNAGRISLTDLRRAGYTRTVHSLEAKEAARSAEIARAALVCRLDDLSPAEALAHKDAIIAFLVSLAPKA